MLKQKLLSPSSSAHNFDNCSFPHPTPPFIFLKKHFSNMLDHMKRDFGDYNWSLRALARRLKELSITCVNYETIVDDVKEAVEKKINGPGKLPG